MAIENATLKQTFDEFMQENKAKNLATYTLNTYKLHITKFLEFDNCWEMSTGLFNITVKDLWEWWIADMLEEKKDVTVTSYCRSVRVFLYWLQDNNYLEPLDLKLPKYQKTIKECYSDEELTIILENPKKGCSEVEYQTWAYINLICATGMRLSSALNIKVGDISKKEHSVVVQKTKNKQAQKYFLSTEVLGILNKYVALFNLGDEDWLFCTAAGNQLARRTIQDYVAKYNRRRGVEKTSIHLLRHTFAKNYYNQTKDIYSLCQILGHSTISTTENYLRDLGLNLANATAYNPQVIYSTQTAKKKRRGKMDS